MSHLASFTHWIAPLSLVWMLGFGSHATAVEHDCASGCDHSLAPTETVADNLDVPPICDGEPPLQDLEATINQFTIEGLFKAAMEPAAETVPASNDIEIDALRSPYTNVYHNGNVTQITYSFYSDAVHGGDYYGSERVSEPSTAAKNNMRDIFSRLEQVVDITFVEVAETANNWGQIRIMLSERYDTGNTDSEGNPIFAGPNYAYAYYPTSSSIHSVASDIHLRKSYDHSSNTNGWQVQPGQHGYMSLIHELGHALGMKHPHDGSDTMPSDRDNTIWTVMSYNFSSSLSASYMALDVKYLHYAYDHAISTLNQGDTTISVSNNLADRHNQGGQLSGNRNIRQALFNNGGTNTLTLAGTAAGTDYIIELKPRGWIRRASVTNRGIMLTDTTRISRVLSGPGNDALYAFNVVANTFAGYAPGNSVGDDIIYDAQSGDTIDLGSYSIATCVETIDGDDALFTMAGDGSVRVVGYWALSAANRPTIIRPPTDGTVQFASPVYEVNEQAGSLTITVTRSGTSGAASVDYSTVDSSALAGTHYSATTGTLSWADGNNDSKTISIPIIDNLIAENQNPQFTLTLSNANGVIAHTPNTTTVTIIDNNSVPTITVNSPVNGRIDIPSGVGLLIDSSVSVDAQQPGEASITWSVDEAPAGATVNWDSTTSAVTGARFSHDGAYALRMQASDGTNTSETTIQVAVGDGSSGQPPLDQLAVWLKLDESSGSTALDSSGNNRDGSLSGSPVWDSNGGHLGGALSFTADNQLATLANSTGLDGVSQMSWSMWMNPSTSNDTVRGILSKRSGASSAQAWSFFLFNGNDLTLDMPSSSNRLSLGAVAANQWTHIAVVFDGTAAQASRIKVYRNGALTHTLAASITAIPNQNNSVTLGTLDAGDSRSFRGKLDEVLIYHARALTSDEVGHIYNNTGNRGPLVTVSGANSIAQGNNLALSGSISDDNLPNPPAAVNAQWTAYSGPGTVTFGDAASAETTASFDQSGSYLLRLSADDGAAKTFAEHAVEVTADNTPGTIVMTQATASVAEDSGSITLHVARQNGSNGSAQISYATANGTASAGSDYTSTSGTLNWADGDSSTKSITVPILVNGAQGNDVTFTVTIADMVGDAQLGSPSQTTVTITNTTFNYAPQITTQPQSTTLFIGQTLNLSVSANASPAPTYQWYFNNNSIADATGSTYSLSDIQLANAGDYHVVVSNNQGSTTSATATVAVSAMDPQLAAWWKLNESSGTSALDSTSNAHHGTLSGLDGGSAWVAGRIAGGLDFDGSGHLETGKTASQLGVNGGATRSVTLWAKTRSFNSGGLFQMGGESSGSMFSLRTTANANEWRIQYWSGDLDFNTTDYGVTSLDRWVHFAHIYHNGQTRIYLNGVHQVTFDRILSTDDSVTMRLGIYRNTTYQGTLDDVRLYARELSDHEVMSIYEEGVIKRIINVGVNLDPSPEWTIDPQRGTYDADGSNRVFGDLIQDQTYTLNPVTGSGG